MLHERLRNNKRVVKAWCNAADSKFGECPVLISLRLSSISYGLGVLSFITSQSFQHSDV
jgi:hypothetical protein